MSQAKVARHFRIAPASVAQWELGRSKPDIDKLADLASLYGVTLEELCGDDIPRPGRRAFVSYSSKDGEKALKLIEDQLLVLNHAWPRLTVEERDSIITMATSLAEARRKTA